MKCMICGKDVTKGIQECLNDSGFVTIEFGYGSKFDGDAFESYIHDECFEKISKNLIQTRTLEDYMKDWK